MKTVSKPIKISGIGIHSGTPVTMTIKPSGKPGIFFKRTDLDCELIPATYDNVLNTSMNTTIGCAPNQVQTIEHFMAALLICGIDSAIVEIDGTETPIMDGSAKKFYEIFCHETKNVKRETKKIIVKKEIIAYRKELIKKMPMIKRFLLWLHNLKTGRREDGYVKLSPDDRGLVIDATLVYPDKIIGTQRVEFIFDGTDRSRERFIKEFARSRTFGRIWEWEHLKKRGLALGANEHNVIALNEKSDGTLNELYYPDEFVRHKIIDALGDMYTSGGFIIGKLESYKGSHGLNNLILRKLFSNPDNYEVV